MIPVQLPNKVVKIVNILLDGPWFDCRRAIWKGATLQQASGGSKQEITVADPSEAEKGLC